MEQGLAETLGALIGAKAAAKVCTFLGLTMVLFGWLRSKAGRGLGRAIIALSQEEDSEDEETTKPIRQVSNGPLADMDGPKSLTRREWHDHIDQLNRVKWSLEVLKLDAEREFGRLQANATKDHEKLGEIFLRLGILEERVEHMEHALDRMSEHCEHCPPSGRR